MSKILDVKSIIRLAKKHGKKPFCPRDELIIALVGLAYFNATELSLIRVKDIISERNSIKLDGYLPCDLGVNKFERYVFIGKKTYLKDCIERYVNWRKENSFDCLDRNLYCGLNPESRLLLKNDGSDFEINYKKREPKDEAATLMHPQQMQRLVKSYFLGEGVSIVNLLDSFIANYWNVKSQQGTTQAIRDLMEMTGLTAETLRKKCTRKQDSIQDILVSLYK